MPYQPETEEREHYAAKEYVHILRATRLQHHNRNLRKCSLPSSFNPPYNISTQAQRICCIQQPFLRSLEHIPLIH